MNTILEFIRRIFGAEDSIDRISRPMQTIITKLNEFAVAEEERANQHVENAIKEDILGKNAFARAEQAEKLAENYRSSGLVPTAASK